jgi:hypothetical protein
MQAEIGWANQQQSICHRSIRCDPIEPADRRLGLMKQVRYLGRHQMNKNIDVFRVGRLQIKKSPEGATQGVLGNAPLAEQLVENSNCSNGIRHIPPVLLSIRMKLQSREENLEIRENIVSYRHVVERTHSPAAVGDEGSRT